MLADPADWTLLGGAEAKTNPRKAETIGQLDLIPPERRVGGPGASYVMAPFTHCSPDRPGRFHDGRFGAFYAAREFETALAETVYHTARFLAATDEAPGWIADKRELVGAIDATLVDLRGTGSAASEAKTQSAEGTFAALLDPDSYTVSQAFARALRAADGAGIVYPSVRQAGGQCFAAFWPDVMAVPVQGRHFSYHWDGRRIDLLRERGGPEEDNVYRLED